MLLLAALILLVLLHGFSGAVCAKASLHIGGLGKTPTVRPELVEACPERLPQAGSRRGLPCFFHFKEMMGFDNGQVRIAPSNPQPSRGLGGLTISPNGLKLTSRITRSPNWVDRSACDRHAREIEIKIEIEKRPGALPEARAPPSTH